MRNMDYIGISQSIGRVIRLVYDKVGIDRQKTFGLVCVPVYDKVGFFVPLALLSLIVPGQDQ